MENSITGRLDVRVNTCIGCDGLEDKSMQFKLHLMNKGESGESKEMSDLVKAERQEICTASWTAKCKSSALTQEERKECNEEAQNSCTQALKDQPLTEIHLDAQKRLQKTHL